VSSVFVGADIFASREVSVPVSFRVSHKTRGIHVDDLPPTEGSAMLHMQDGTSSCDFASRDDDRGEEMDSTAATKAGAVLHNRDSMSELGIDGSLPASQKNRSDYVDLFASIEDGAAFHLPEGTSTCAFNSRDDNYGGGFSEVYFDLPTSTGSTQAPHFPDSGSWPSTFGDRGSYISEIGLQDFHRSSNVSSFKTDIVVMCDNEAAVTVLNSGLQSPLQLLDSEVDQAKKSAFAAGTYSDFRTQWRAFLLFCEFFGLPAIPTDSKTLTRFAQFLSRSLKSPNSVQLYVHGARTLQRFHGFEPPPAGGFELKLVINSIRRSSSHVPQQKLPITPAILLRIREELDLTRPLHATLWAAFCVAFFSLLRKSNLVPKSQSSFDPAKHLTRRAIQVSGDCVVLRVTWSKTIQFRQKVLLLPLPELTGHPLCPKHAYLHMCNMIRAPLDAPAFLVPSTGGGLTYLTHDTLVKHLKTLLYAVGLPPSSYSGHSFRRGGATYAWHCGADPQVLKLLGDWSSDAFQAYLDCTFDQRYEFAQLLAGKIKSGILAI